MNPKINRHMIQKSNIKIIAGIYKGRKLYMPKDIAIRPTTGVMKEALFSFLMSKHRDNIVGANILDICAGTGALGFEALSRGANYVQFCDLDKSCIDAISMTTENFNIDNSKYKAYVGNAANYKFDFNNKKYDLVFIDPPYDDSKLLVKILSNITNVTSDNCIICIERRRSETVDYNDNIEIIKTMEHMDSAVDFVYSR